MQYLFPKAHAVAYVLNAYRIAYCKVHHPLAYYAAYFTQRADVDATHIAKGEAYIRQFIKNVELQGREAKTVDKDTVIYLQLVLELSLIHILKLKIFPSASESMPVLCPKTFWRNTGILRRKP